MLTRINIFFLWEINGMFRSLNISNKRLLTLVGTMAETMSELSLSFSDIFINLTRFFLTRKIICSTMHYNMIWCIITYGWFYMIKHAAHFSTSKWTNFDKEFMPNFFSWGDTHLVFWPDCLLKYMQFSVFPLVHRFHCF